MRRRNGTKRCPKCSQLKKFTTPFCYACEHPKLMVPRNKIPELVAQLRARGHNVEAVETKPGQFDIRVAPNP